MRFLAPCVLLGLLAPLAQAQDDGISGNWKVSLLQEGQQINFWLVHLENKDSKITGTGDPVLDQIPGVTVTGQVEGDVLNLTLVLNKLVKAEFEGKLPKVGAKKIFGSVTGVMMPAVVIRPTVLFRRLVNQSAPSGPTVMAPPAPWRASSC